MPGTYTPTLGAKWGGNADCQGFYSNRFVPMDCGSVAMNDATKWNATPVDGALGYKSTVGAKHLIFHDTALAVNADVLVPRIDAGYNEQVLGQWAFAYNPGGASSITIASTTRVDNLNAHYLADSGGTGRSLVTTATASSVAQRDSNGRLTAADPGGVALGELVTYGFLYNFIQGVRDPKQAAKMIFNGDLNAAYPYTWNVGNQTITVNANGVVAFDGQTVAANDRVGLVFETGANQPYNGLYVVNQAGTASLPLILQRASDADTDAEVTNGLQFWVTTGTTYGDSGWLLTTADPITLNTTALVFVQNNGTAGITAGNGIVKSGNTIHAVQSASYTTGGIVYANATTTLTLFTTAGVVQATSGGAPTAATGTQYGVPYWATTTTLGTTAAGTSTTILHGNAGGAPTWSAVSLTADITGTLGIGNGGTNATSYGANRVIHMNAGNTAFTSNAGFTYDGTTLTLDADLTFTGAQTISTSTGNLTISTSAGNGNILLSPHGTGNVNAVFAGASGMLNVTHVGDRQIFQFGTSSGGTGFLYGDIINTGATLRLGINGTPASLVGSGGLAYSSCLFTGNATALQLGTNNAINVTILSGGNVGIGTTGPTSRFHVAQDGADDANATFSQFRVSGTSDTTIVLNLGYDTTNDHGFLQVADISTAYKNMEYGAAQHLFKIGSTTKVTIDASGNVGIGTTAPSTLLHLGLAGTTLGTLGFAGNTSGLITMNSAAAAGTWTFTLPTSGGTANYALITNGSGVSSWSILPEAGGGTGRADFYYAETIGGAATFTITHNLGTRDVHVTVYDLTTGAPDYDEIHMVRIQHLTTNTVYLTFGFTLGASQCRVVVT